VAENPNAPPIGIVIPTYNRGGALMECLRHLEAQTWQDFEVVVVDDGSTDETQQLLAEYSGRARLPMRCLRQTNSGPATARNRAIAALSAPLCIMIGDDIFASPEFVAEHMEFHRAHPAKEAAAVGLTRWSEEGQKVTPLMRWLEDGIQFSYGDLLAGKPPDWQHFYTSNLSLKTEFLREHPAHEGFRQYGFEDIEQGYRMQQQAGLKMYFVPEALAEHLHPTDYLRSCRRMLHIGESGYELGKLWPHFAREATKSRLKAILLTVLTEPKIVLPFLRRMTDALNRVWFPNPLTWRVMQLHERLGYRRAAAKAEKVERSA